MKEKRTSDTKRFLLTLLATTFSIILTFGTSAIIERRHKAAAKKEMVMMKTFSKSVFRCIVCIVGKAWLPCGLFGTVAFK